MNKIVSNTLNRLEPNLDQFEEDYQYFYLEKDKYQSSLTALVTIFANLFFVGMDFITFGDTQRFFPVLICRLLIFIALSGYLWISKNISLPGTYSKLTFSVCLFCTVYIVIIDFIRPPDFIGHLAINAIFIFIIYIIIPNTIGFRIVSGISFTLMIIAVLIIRHTQIQALDIAYIIISLLIVNILGLWGSIRIYRYRRLQFKAMKEEQRLRLDMTVMANTDALTGIFNRRKFLELGQKEFRRYTRYGHTFSIAIIDVDHFKKINDNYGHHCGDQALQHVTRLIDNRIRETDEFGRLGGEEFGLLFTDTESEATTKIGESLKSLVEDTPFVFEQKPIHITVSIGITASVQSDKSIDQMLQRADMALYKAKNNGRNRVEYL